MKALGFTGAAMGAAAAAAPVFQDLDEVASSATSVGPSMPWYVKKREAYNPTLPVDWSLVRPFDQDERDVMPYTKRDPTPPEAFEEEMLKIDPDLNWTDPRRQAMQSGARTSFSRSHTHGSWLGDLGATTPEKGGYPKWTGTLEENHRLLTGAARFFGSQGVGPMERDTNFMKMMFKKRSRTLYNFYNNIDMAEERTGLPGNLTERAIPESYNWAFVWIFRQPMNATMRQAGGGGKTDRNPLRLAENWAMAISYNRLDMVEDRIQKFLMGLGYHGVAGGMQGNLPGNAMAIMSGWAEHVRMGQPVSFPRWGVTPRGTYKMITNFPLPPSTPIDFGNYEFCKNCEICSETCPSNSIQKGDPTWEGNPVGNPAQSTGYLGWHTEFQSCPHCPICHRMCPFNALETDGSSFVHDLVKVTITNTTLFNGFFANLERTFKYAELPEAGYWEVFDKDPVWGWDSRT
jgi:reductive dehalogenase